MNIARTINKLLHTAQQLTRVHLYINYPIDHITIITDLNFMNLSHANYLEE